MVATKWQESSRSPAKRRYHLQRPPDAIEIIYEGAFETILIGWYLIYFLVRDLNLAIFYNPPWGLFVCNLPVDLPLYILYTLLYKKQTPNAPNILN